MLTIKPAGTGDIPALTSLLNQAYRGESSRKGWTHEADLLTGTIRADEAMLRELIADKESVILKCEDESGNIAGCVYLKKHSRRLYLGMLSVNPALQGRGIGKMFLQKAEAYARAVGCEIIFMQVISARQDLMAWYLRHGYRPTGERKPFEVDPKYGIPVKPLEFLILEKNLNSIG